MQSGNYSFCQCISPLRLNRNIVYLAFKNLFTFLLLFIQCLLAGHRRCFQFLMIKCNYKPLSEKEKVFGVELFEVGQIPEVLVSCIREAERRGYKNIKGIYRIGGNKHNVTRIRSSFENGPYLVDLRKVPCYDIGEIVKLYLSEVSMRDLRFLF